MTNEVHGRIAKRLRMIAEKLRKDAEWLSDIPEGLKSFADIHWCIGALDGIADVLEFDGGKVLR